MQFEEMINTIQLGDSYELIKKIQLTKQPTKKYEKTSLNVCASVH